MDLNYLFHRQQIERSRAEAARSQEARRAHLILACRYEEQIEQLSEGRITFVDRQQECGSNSMTAG